MAGQTVVRPWWLFGWAAAGLAVVVAASAVAAGGRVGAAERAVFEAVNGLPDALRWPMWVFQLLGLLLIPLAVAAVALAMRRIRLAIALVALVGLKLLAEKAVVKELVHRERPGRTEPNAVLRDVPSAGNSFPSGHAIIAFGIAALLTPYLGRWGRVVVWTLAGLNGVARVYLGAHNPLDVVCGAAVGVVLGSLLAYAVGIPARKRAETGVVA